MAATLLLLIAATAWGQGAPDDLGLSDGSPSAAYLKLRGGDARGAIADLRKEPDSPGVRKMLAVAYYMERQYTLFADMMRSVIAETPADFAPYYYLGRHYDTDLRDFRGAASYFESAAERNRTHAPSYYYLGFSLEQLGEYDRSEQAYARARSLRKDYAAPLFGLARLKLIHGEAAEAAKLAEEGIKLAPSDLAGLKVLARARAASGDKRGAAEAWKGVAVLDSTDASAQYQLYRYYLEAGEKQRAANALARFEELRKIYGVE